MGEMFKNLIAGEWVGTDGAENINPSNLSDVVGVYARATKEDALSAIAAAKAVLNAFTTFASGSFF